MGNDHSDSLAVVEDAETKDMLDMAVQQSLESVWFSQIRKRESTRLSECFTALFGSNFDGAASEE